MKTRKVMIELSFLLLASTLLIAPKLIVKVEAQNFQPHLPIDINGNAAFTSMNGVSAGDGSFLNPFIIRSLNITAPNGAAINITGTTDYFIIENVLISRSQYGIVLNEIIDGQVSNSTIASNQNGVLLLFSNETLIYNNDFLGNTHQANDTGGYYNAWDNGYAAGGNYWSDYTGVDKCSGYAPQRICPDPDGIGDTPYIIAGDSGSVDNYPLMKPYLPDILPPTWPSDKRLTDLEITAHSLSLKWTNATDDTGVTMYRVFESNLIIANVTANHDSYNVTGLEASTAYTFRVEAGDHSNNWSNNGPSLTVKTLSISFWSTFVDFSVRNWYVLVSVSIAALAVLVIVLRFRRGSGSSAFQQERGATNGAKKHPSPVRSETASLKPSLENTACDNPEA